MGVDAAVVGLWLIFLVGALVIGTLVAAIMLRAAVSLYNKMAGGANSPSAVPEPPMGKAMGVAIVTTFVNFVVASIVHLVIGWAAAAESARDGGVNVTAQLVSLSIGVLVMAGLLSALLPTTFGRGIVVTLFYFLIALVTGGIIVMIGAVVA